MNLSAERETILLRHHRSARCNRKQEEELLFPIFCFP